MIATRAETGRTEMGKVKLTKYKLGEIGEISMCKRVLKTQTNTSGGIPFYKIGSFGSVTDCYISRELFELYKSQYSYPKKGDVLLSAAGTIGRTVIFNGEDAYFQDCNIVWINNDESRVLNSFLFYLYKTIQWTPSTGSTILRLYNDDIRNTIVHVPPLPIQRKIAAVLTALDDKIDLNKRIKDKLESMAKRLYDYWFVQFDFPDENGRPYKSSGGKMVWNETLKREIPAGWEVKPLSFFASYGTDSIKAEKAYNYISTDNMLPEKQGISDVILQPASGNILAFKKNNILVSNIRPYFKKIWLANYDGTCSTDVLCIQTNSSNYNFYVYRTLWRDDFFDYMMQGAKGSKMPRGDKAHIMNYPICFHKHLFKFLMDVYNSKCVCMQNLLYNNLSEISRLMSLRDRLLSLLMNGQVEVM